MVALGKALPLKAKTDEPQIQQWVVERLLPWAYWHQQAEKTQKSELLRAYQAGASLAYERLMRHRCLLCAVRAAWRRHVTTFQEQGAEISNPLSTTRRYCTRYAKSGCPGQTGSVQNINAPLQQSKGAMAICLVSIIPLAVWTLKL